MKYNKHYNPHHLDRLIELKGKPLASFTRRAIAFIIDLIASTILLLIGMIIYGLASKLITPIHKGLYRVNLTFGQEVSDIILELVVPIAYAGLLVYITQGKTIGKWIMGIRVVSLTHHRISFIHSAERAMAYVTSILEFGFGFAQYFMNVNHRTLGDKVGETIVIRDRLTHKEKLHLQENEETVTIENALELEEASI